MKRSLITAVLIALSAGALGEVQGQVTTAPGGKTLAATMNVYVFPAAGQAPDQQSRDEAECYNWAVQNTGTDPFELTKRAEQEKQQAEQSRQQAQDVGRGAGASGAVRGAAAGALIGEIASDDPGKGAAYGAAAGAIRGRRRGAAATSQAERQADQQAQATQASIQEQMSNFKKAFSVCLEAKDYMVKH